MADIVEMLLADHALIRRLIAEVETALEQPDDADSRAELPGRWEMLAALLDMHADVVEEIGFPALFRRAATVARDNARATHGDLRESVREARLYPAGSRSWRLAVLAACAAAVEHIDDLESGALARFQRDAPMPVREALGQQWVAFVAVSTAGDTRRNQLCKKVLWLKGPWCDLLLLVCPSNLGCAVTFISMASVNGAAPAWAPRSQRPARAIAEPR